MLATGGLRPALGGESSDVVCGTGYGSALLSRQGVVTGLDYDPAAIDAARVTAPQADFVVAKLPLLPFDRLDRSMR